MPVDVDSSGRVLTTRTRTFSPFAARRVGPRWLPLKPQVGVLVPAVNSVSPACIRRSKTRVPSASTVDAARGGTTRALRKSTAPTVDTLAPV